MASEPSKSAAHSASDQFVLEHIYRNADSVFRHAAVDKASILDNAIIVLDTNSLLVPYSAGSASLQAIKSLFTQYAKSKRLYLPAQVAREFARNKASRIVQIFDQVAARTSRTRLESIPILESISAFAALKKVEQDIDALFEQSSELTKQVLSAIREWQWNDPVTSIYSEVFNTHNIVELEHDRTELSREHEYNLLHHIPPGYKDASKEDRGIGDLIIWRTILQLARKHKQHTVFVTDEQKADWWTRARGSELFPRPELQHEYCEATDGKAFVMMKLSGLLELAGAIGNVIEEVRLGEAASVIATSSGKRYADFHTLCVDAICTFVAQMLVPPYRISNQSNGTGADLVISTPDQMRSAIIIKALHGGYNFELDFAFSTAYELAKSGSYTHVVMFLICDSDSIEDLDPIRKLVESKRSLYPLVYVVLATIKDNVIVRAIETPSLPWRRR